MLFVDIFKESILVKCKKAFDENLGVLFPSLVSLLCYGWLETEYWIAWVIGLTQQGSFNLRQCEQAEVWPV